jgi:23S rRNA pseudouridine1911/1915/1917 synthase
MAEKIELEAVIPAEAAGRRLDAVLAELFPEFSRSRLQRWLKDGELTVDGGSPRGRVAVRGGEQVVVAAEMVEEGPVEAEPIPLDVVYEDDAILVVNKPAGLVVHPGAGNPTGTLQNALLHHSPALHAVPRAGIVHRLDRDTTGLMVVAKTLAAHTSLVTQLQARTVGREYLALVMGTFTAGGKVDAPIGRHPRDRLRMAVRAVVQGVDPRDDGTEDDEVLGGEAGVAGAPGMAGHGGAKPAVTHYRVEERFPAHTLLRCKLETGRTHQIRVHMAHIKHPIVGDPLYGGRLRLPGGVDDVSVDTTSAGAEGAVQEAPEAVGAGPGERPALTVGDVMRRLHCQALHAETLTLEHPESGESMTWTAEPPADFAQVLAAMRVYREAIGQKEADNGRWRP